MAPLGPVAMLPEVGVEVRQLPPVADSPRWGIQLRLLGQVVDHGSHAHLDVLARP